MKDILQTLENYKAIYLNLSYQERVGGFDKIVKEWQSEFNANIYLWNLKNPQFVKLNKYYEEQKLLLQEEKKDSAEYHNLQQWLSNEDEKRNYQNLDDWLLEEKKTDSNKNFSILEKAIEALNAIYHTKEDQLTGKIFIVENIDVLLIKGNNENKALYESYLLEIVEKFRNRKSLYLVLLGKDLLEWDYHSIIPQLSLPLPTKKERYQLLNLYFKKEFNNSRQTNSSFLEKCATILGGLNKQEIEWGLEKINLSPSSFNEESFASLLLDYKQKQLANLKLKFVPPPEIAEIGGMEELEAELENVAAQFNSQLVSKLKIPLPKGWVLAGSPGTGKSMAAKVVASRLKFPIIAINAEDLKAKGLLNAIQIFKRVERASPCVLYIDELDKLVGKFEQQSDATKEVFGYFLTWLQEKTSPVFCIATLNRIDSIPPEIVRSGRFDEKFHVEYPSPMNRFNIFRIHLKRYDPRYGEDKVLSDDEWQDIINKTERYTGAEIEQIVLNAVREVITSRYLNQDDTVIIKIGYSDILRAKSKVVSVFAQNQDEIFAMENSLKNIFRPVAKEDNSIFADSHLSSWDD